MSSPQNLLVLTGVLLLSLFTASVAGAAYYVDPPGRVARLEQTQGEVSYSPAGENEWFNVVRNRPLIRGDRLWTGRGARAEFQVGSSAFRLGSNTSVELLDLGDRIAQVQLTQGTLNLSVRRIHAGQIFEVATPTLAFIINRAGRYRIDVDPRNAVTTIVVWEGAGEAYGENSTFPLRAGDTVRFYGTDLRDYEMYGLPREDDFDRYGRERDRRLDRSASLRYLDDDVVGYADLDDYGSWRTVRDYGNVWFPGRVGADWAPYRDGHWAWQEPWGWTWVDNAPWGFAPSHYGRWAYISNRWGWIPGPRNVRSVYAPALVAFVGGRGLSGSRSPDGSAPIGWFPLGPREVYVPSYRASRDYFRRVNVNNTAVNNTAIARIYDNYSSGTVNIRQVDYANRRVAGAVTAVPGSVFVNAQPVQRSAMRLDQKTVAAGEITRVAPIAPSARSVIGTGTAVGARPSRVATERQVFVRNAPPPDVRPFAERERQLQKSPGQALEPGAVNPVQSRDGKTAKKVRVIGDQRGAVNARAAGSRRGDGKPDTPAAAPEQLLPLDRSVEPAKESGPVTGDISKDKEGKGQSDTQQQAVEQQQAERQRKAEIEQKAIEQQQAESQRKSAIEQKAIEQQQAESQRKSAIEQKAIEQQQAESQRKVDVEKKAAERRQAERQREVETPPQEQGQRDAVGKEEATEPQGQAATPQQEQRKTRRQRQSEALQQLQATCEREAIAQNQDVHQCQAECEREAIRQHLDVHQCQPPLQESPGNPGENKNGK